MKIFTLGSRFNFKEYPKEVKGRATESLLKTTEVLLDFNGYALT